MSATTPVPGAVPIISAIPVALCLYLILAPVWLPSIAPRMYDNARILELATLCLLSVFALVPPVSRAIAAAWRGLPPLARGLAAIFVLGGLASVLASAAPQVGAQQLAVAILLAGSCVLVCLAVGKRGAAVEKILSIAIFTGAALVVLKFWATYLLSLAEGRPFSWVSPFMDFANVRFFGQYQAYALLLVALPVALMDWKGIRRFAVYFIAANFWAMQWMVGSRAVWVGFAVALLATAAALPRKRLAWVATLLAPVLLGGAIFGLFTWVVQSLPQATPIPAINSIVDRSGESDSARLTMAKAALRLVGEHPFTGVGPGQFGMHYSETAAAHPHNSPLQLLVEYGIPAGAAAIALGAMLVIYAVRQIRRRSLQRPDIVSTTLGAALIMGLTDALFSGNLIMPHSQILLAVTAGWLLGRQQQASAASYTPATRMRQLQFAVAGMAALAALVTAILAVEYVQLIQSMPYPPGLRIPNFWQYGRFTAW